MNKIVLAMLETAYSVGYERERQEVQAEANVRFHSLQAEVPEFDRLYRERALAGLQRADVATSMPLDDFVTMERLFERHQVFPVTGEDRRGEIIGAVSFWYQKLEAAGVDAVFFATSSPHWPFNYAIHVAAKLLGVPVFSASTEFITKRVHLYSGLKDSVLPRGPARTPEAIAAFLENSARSVENPAYINAYFNSGNSYARFFWQAAKNIRRVLRRIAREDTWSMFDARQVPRLRLTYALLYLRKAMKALAAIRGLRRSYRRNAAVTLDDVPDDAVVFYASYQPEATTCPDAWFFHDFRLALRSLVERGYKVYYREHPTVFLLTIGQMLNFVGVYRDGGYYDELARMGVKVLDTDISHASLLSKFKMFATCTGTVALQAAAQGKHVIVFGKPWYGTPPGILSYFAGEVPSPRECLASPAPQVATLLPYFARNFGTGFQNFYGLQGYAPEPSVPEYKAFLHHLADAARSARARATRLCEPAPAGQEVA